MAWINEVAWANTSWTYTGFSPIVISGGHYVVYAHGYGSTIWSTFAFYKYDLTSQIWTSLAQQPDSTTGIIAMSPNGRKLAAVSVNNNRLELYTIETNLWTSSSTRPVMTDCTTTSLNTLVWADDNTLWVHVNGLHAGTHYHVKCYKYVVSTNTWTQYAGYLDSPAVISGSGMSVNTAGTALYIGNLGANNYAGMRYIIATDAYSNFSVGSGYAFYNCSDRNAKLWFWDTLTSYTGVFYYDCDAATNSASIFAYDSSRTKPTNLACGIYGTSHIIAWHLTATPYNRSNGDTAAVPTVFPTNAITRVTNLIHRYNRKEGSYTLELALGEVTSDFGLPEWMARPQASIPETDKRRDAQEFANSPEMKEQVYETVDEAIKAAMVAVPRGIQIELPSQPPFAPSLSPLVSADVTALMQPPVKPAEVKPTLLEWLMGKVFP